MGEGTKWGTYRDMEVRVVKAFFVWNKRERKDKIKLLYNPFTLFMHTIKHNMFIMLVM